MIRHAEWCDVTAVEGGWAWTYISRPTDLTCETPTGVSWGVTLPEWLLSVRCSAMGEHVAVIGQGHDTGLLRLVIDGRLVATDGLPMLGRSVIRAMWNRWELAVQTGSMTWRWVLLHVDGTRLAYADHAMPQTSQGFLRWDGNMPARTDDVREYRIDGRVALLYPQIVDPLVLGQHPTGNRVTGIWQGQRVRVADIDAYEPYGAALAGDSYAIASRTPYGAELQIVHPPFALDPFEPVPTPTPEPPTPTPEPTPVPPAPTPTPTPIPPEPDPMPEYPYPDEQTWWPARIAEMEALYAEAGHTINLGAFLWLTRTAYDARVMPQEAAWRTHRAELRAALGLPPDPT